MKLIRWILKIFVYLIDALFQPRFKKRSKREQELVDQKTKNLTLYQFYACPFCVKVRWAARRMGINLKIKDAKNDQQSRETLLKKGGKVQVPCLHIKNKEKEEWLYESKAIIEYLSQAIQ